MKRIYFLFLLSTLLFACKSAKENPTPESPDNSIKTGSFTVEFQTMAGTQDFLLGKKYVNAAGEPFVVDVFKYYVSNIKLTKPDGSEQSLASQYFLVDADGKEKITVHNVPVGTYSSLSFDIGVDSARNVSGAQTGALDPSNGLFWDWNTGYIFLMMNGTSDSSKQASKQFLYHVSGFKKVDFAVQTIASTFPSHLEIRQNAVPNLHYYVDILELFKDPVTISIAKLSTIHMPGSNAMMVSRNYKDMFQLAHIEN